MRGFTLIEMIFVIVILALLSSVASYYLPDNTLHENAKILKEKILDKRSNAINFAVVGENNLTCVVFETDKLNSDENASRVKYHFSKRVKISLSGCDNRGGIDFDENKTICFDKFGRAFAGAVDDKLENLCNNNAIISLSYKSKDKNITIYTISGAVR